jgi:hypothetical protein
MKFSNAINKIKIRSSYFLLIMLGGCSGSAPSTGSPAVINSPETIHHQAVVISQTSIMPTNLGVNGSYSIKVDNFTGKNLFLKNFNLSGSSSTNSLFAKSYSALRAAVSAVGYDSRINVLGCSTLASNSSCVIIFSPDEADGSAALRLNFVDEYGTSYPAAQLFEYSSRVNKSNGFYVSNTHITNVVTTNNYSLAIPFVSDDDYESIEIDSRIITLAKSVDCAKGASKGTHCTALLTLPAADPKSGGYNNSITIKGTKVDGSVRATRLSSGTTYNDTAHLVISSGPIVIKATDSTSGHPSLTKTINIVNNGVTDALAVSGLSLVNDKWADGQYIYDTVSFLSKTIRCGGIDVGTLPVTLAAADSCEVKFTLTNPNSAGSEDYQVSYSGGAAGAQSIITSTKVYFKGLARPEYAYIVTGDIDFNNVGVGNSVATTILVENTGSKAIQDIAYATLPALPTDITIDARASSCSTYTGGKQLPAGNYCTYTLKYTPQASTSPSSFNFKVTANNTAMPSAEISPAQSLAIRYSAVATGGNGLVVVNNSKGYLIFANGVDKRVSQVLIQNTGYTDFNLIKITAIGWSPNLSFFGRDYFLSPYSVSWYSNPLAGVSSTDGNYEAVQVIPAGDIATLDYFYGPTSLEEEGIAQQYFVGKFSGSASEYFVVNSIAYKAVTGGVIVSNEPVTSGTPGAINNTNASSPNEFVLTKDNQAKVSFKYSTGTQPVTGFLVNDSDIPFGFMVDPDATSCPTTSKADGAGELAANTSCVVSYTYLASDLNHSFFYTAAIMAGVKIFAPVYSVKDATGIHVVTPTNSIVLNPRSFVHIETSEVVKSTVSDATLYSVTFTATGYANDLLPGGQIVITPTFGGDVYPKNARTCTITNPEVRGSCVIEIYKTGTSVGIARLVPFNYASTKDADFNSYNSSFGLRR